MRGFFFFPSFLSDEWRLSSKADANGNAQPSSLAAKGYRSVHPSLPSDKPQVGTCPGRGGGWESYWLESFSLHMDFLLTQLVMDQVLSCACGRLWRSSARIRVSEQLGTKGAQAWDKFGVYQDVRTISHRVSSRFEMYVELF